MAFTKEIYYEGSADNHVAIYGANWTAQTFTTVGAFTLTKVGIYAGVREGTPVVPKIFIFATTGGKPSGAALGSQAIIPGNMTADDNPSWYELEFDTPVALSATTQYAIVVGQVGGESADAIWWYYDSTATAYADGAINTSGNSGGTWSTVSSIDALFRTYSGNDIVNVDLAFTDTVTFSETLSLGSLILIGFTDAITFSESMTLSFGPLSGVKAEKDTRRIVAFGNDRVFYEAI